MEKLIKKIEADDYCYGDPWGETTCPEFNQDTNICNEDCLQCKIQRIKEIIDTIKFN